MFQGLTYQNLNHAVLSAIQNESTALTHAAISIHWARYVWNITYGSINLSITN